MILIQIILIIIILLVAIRFIGSRNTSSVRAYKKVVLVFGTLIAVIVILFPNLSTDAAKYVGVGRGTDLLVYGLTLVVIFQTLNRYIKEKEDHRNIVILARRLAIIEAEQLYSQAAPEILENNDKS